MMGMSTTAIFGLILAFGIGMLAAILVFRPTIVIQNQSQSQSQPGMFGLLVALVALMVVWLALAQMIS